jgi:hypothetical protein
MPMTTAFTPFRTSVVIVALALTAALGAPPSNAEAVTTAAGMTVTVPANRPWTDGGVDVSGSVTLHAEGKINVGGPEVDLSPAGSRVCTASPTRYSGQWTAPGLPCWSLIARVGGYSPFAVGDGGTFIVPTGRLYLGVNDETGAYGDNRGAWTVRVGPAGTSSEGALTAPARVRSVGEPDSFRISWTDNSPDESGFHIFNGNETRVVPANTTSYRWAAHPRQYMCVAVRAFDAGGQSAWAGMWTCTTTPERAAGAPGFYAPWANGKEFAVGDPPRSGVGGGYYGHCCPGTPADQNYYAVDINGRGDDCGEDVITTNSGMVSKIGTYDESGEGLGRISYVQVDHGGGYVSEYQHVTDPVSVGTTVGRGDVIAELGRVGATSCHLHFVVRLNGKSVPPSPMSGVGLPATGGIYVTSNNVKQ